MEYALGFAVLALFYAVLNFFRKAAERRRELHIRSLSAPVGGDGISRFVCVHRTDGSSASYFRPGAEE